MRRQINNPSFCDKLIIRPFCMYQIKLHQNFELKREKKYFELFLNKIQCALYHK